MNILIVNGPNLNFLGLREPEIYGKKSYNDLVNFLLAYGNMNRVEIEVYQSNCEGEIINIIQNNYQRFDALIINPAAYTHYSYAIYDCIKSINIPTVEVHLSDIYKRESFRKISVIEPACVSKFYGKGFNSYIEAINFLRKRK
ncbi:type II 3-dehydroquinate dehydratase [Candidatus Izemoplasma sp. B36]|uniref:type II 3-dehydroquinate dehydratase n=1 Tax=Candidatus Izemoplasma sp. B36 TaxID=3242468 RepID=UPI003558F14C